MTHKHVTNEDALIVEIAATLFVAMLSPHPQLEPATEVANRAAAVARILLDAVILQSTSGSHL